MSCGLCPPAARETMVELAVDNRAVESDAQKIRALALEIAHAEVLHVEYALPRELVERLDLDGEVGSDGVATFSCDIVGIDRVVFPRHDPLLLLEARQRAMAMTAHRRGKSRAARRLAKAMLTRDPDDALARRILDESATRARRDYRFSAVLGSTLALGGAMAAGLSNLGMLLALVAPTIAITAVMASALNRMVGMRLPGPWARPMFATLGLGAVALAVAWLIVPPTAPWAVTLADTVSDFLAAHF